MSEFNVKNINGLLTFLDSLSSSVLWMRNQGYDKQLYVSNNIEKIWSVSPEVLYKTPEAWKDFLLPEDATVALKKTSIRKEQFNTDNSVVFYRIKDAHGNIRCIKDTCFGLVNTNNQLIVYAGIAEEVNPVNWQMEIENDANTTETNSKQHQLIQIIQAELGLNPQSAVINKTHKKWVNQTVQSIPTLFGEIEVTKREAQCLFYLGQGLSAKETAHILHISPRTVESYLESLRQKAQAKSKIELLAKMDWRCIQLD